MALFKPVETIHSDWELRPKEQDGPLVQMDLPRGNCIQIWLRKKVTPAEFESLRRIFELSAVAFIQDQQPSSEEAGESTERVGT